MKHKIIIKIIVLSLVVANCFISITTAKVTLENDYVLSTDRKTILIPKAYTLKSVINRINGYSNGDVLGKLNTPKDLFIDNNDELFIADTGNNKVIKINTKGDLIKEFKQANGKMFKEPSGIYVNEEYLYIGDSSNERIVVLNKNGDFVKQFIKPVSDMLYNVHSFRPSKIVYNKSLGYLYVIQGKQFMILDDNNSFRGYVGASEVGFNIRDVIVRMFASPEQIRKLSKREPPANFNVMIGNDGLIYAVGDGTKGQIKVINSIGNNIYPIKFYGELEYLENGTPQYPEFTDIAVTKDNTIAVADSKTSKMYLYDQVGNLLSAFGGKGSINGRFEAISSIAYDSKGMLYILDSALNNIQIFEPTNFINKVTLASNLYFNGSYQESLSIWQDVSKICSNYPLAKENIAKIMYKNKSYERSMKEYYLADNKVGYGKAFNKFRHEFQKNNFLLVVLVIIFLIALFAFILIKIRKSSEKYEEKEYFGRDGK